MIIMIICSVFIFLKIMIGTSDKIFINYYKDILQSLNYDLDINTYKRFIENPTKASLEYNSLFEYLNSYSTTLDIKNIYISTINEETNTEFLLIHGSDKSASIGDTISSNLGNNAFKLKEVKCARVNNNNPNYSFYSPILNDFGNPIGLIAFKIPVSTLSNLNSLKFIDNILLIILSTILFIILYIYISTIMLWNIFKPIYIIKNQVISLSNKILSINRNISFPTYEFNKIQQLLTKSIDIIKKFILNLIIYLEYVKFSIAKTKVKSIEITHKIKSTISNITSVSKSTEDINSKVYILKNDIKHFSDNILEIKDEIKETLSSNVLATNMCQNNNNLLNIFLMEISTLIKKFKVEQIECKKLKFLSDKINKILSNILNITNETKLLSLNASIVAISAGEHGKSFGVIAKEIGELSQNIIKSTSYIQKTLIKISDTINALNQESIEIFESFKIHSENSKAFISNLSEMYTSIKNITNFLKNISYSTDKISNKNNLLIESITSLSSNSSYNLNSVKQIENLITKINDNTLTFKNSFDSLSDNINQIKSELNKFKL
ncbi:methyl-accepting chemotaxis protein [Candidatus Arthromitus sp. SFB-rat-Yit]|uniref:methyl-accepting chemotaxis protein n=1 Tax=Candidatus Arthromitus sp. SFB-rat-Yit TaxID=1041504 RepID=UPI000227A4F7|nr:methyl-accepting chemotaxis protein [Candidatus Arthromitus sp. SFB-rat-Yit]BAK81576.1 putative Methyl-accepting chemotaxis protein [Candidatus Arthromitus sp. SFB-rat-Yit]